MRRDVGQLSSDHLLPSNKRVLAVRLRYRFGVHIYIYIYIWVSAKKDKQELVLPGKCCSEDPALRSSGRWDFGDGVWQPDL